MSGVTGISGAGVGGVVSALTQTPSVQPAASTTSSSTADATVIGSSRTESNPLAKVFVTQYLDNSGNVTSQIPSTAVVAYLQNGLSPDGSPKQSSVA